jgi:hypothetical protein
MVFSFLGNSEHRFQSALIVLFWNVTIDLLDVVTVCTVRSVDIFEQ